MRIVSTFVERICVFDFGLKIIGDYVETMDIDLLRIM
jgi:hypothetical protein